MTFYFKFNIKQSVAKYLGVKTIKRPNDAPHTHRRVDIGSFK